jgi:hypothetical protein
MNKRLCLLCFLFLPCLSLSALDFGMFLNQNAGYGGVGGDRHFDYSIGAAPRFSGLTGQTGDFIVTAGFEADYSGHPGRGGWGFVPELLQTEIAFRPGDWAFEIGRMYHSDPLGFIAEGLFDGARAAYYTEAGAAYALPTNMKSRLSFLARYSSGDRGGLAAFLPFTNESQENILEAKLTGL